jgi:hypothetical protein
MRDYRYDHVHLRSPDPDATAPSFRITGWSISA